VIRDKRELNRFVVRTCALCVAIALAVDVVNHIVFFISWTEAIRSWAITIGLAFAVAFPVSRVVGRAYLALSRSRERFEVLSRTDELTGLLNRRALWEVASRLQPEKMALVIADLDRFKQINDTHGHLAGDRVLEMVSRLAVAELGDLGHLGRIGGEEFALLGSDTQSGLIKLRLERLRTNVSLTPVVMDGTAVHVTLSAGVAMGMEGQTFDQLFVQADKALYVAKATGRNRICFAEDPLSARAAGLQVKRA